MPELKLVSGPGEGRRVALESLRAVRIGRGAPPANAEPETEHVQVDDKRLSRVHCEVARSGSGWLVRDLGSSNGTFVNGERVTEKMLARGDLVQVGGTILEVEGIEEPRGESRPGSQPSRRVVRRRRPAPSSAMRYALLAAGVCVAAGLAYVSLAPKSDEPAAATVAANSTPPSAPRSPPLEATAPRLESAPADGDPTAAVDAPLLAGDYRRAIDIVEEALKGPRSTRAEELRKKVEDAAVLALAERLKEAERLTGAGDYAAARSRLEDLRPRLPDDLVVDIDLALSRLRKLEGADPKRGESPKSGATRVSGETRPSGRLAELQASYQRLSASPSTPRDAWASLRDEVGGLARQLGSDPSFPAQREQIRSLLAACYAKVQDPALIRACFSAGSVAWKDGRVTLRYDFESDDQLRDFHAVGAGSSARRDGRALALRGECRMLGGEPFEGSLSVRGKIGASGYDSKGPNINVALFTREGLPLTDDRKPPPSLFLAYVRGTGHEPNDFAAFCLGYRVPTADYNGKLLEQITPDGTADPIQMPVHAILTGKHGTLIHADTRDCVWAVPSGGSPRGAVEFEIVLDGGSFAWSVNGKPLVDAADSRLARLRALNEPAGSVTLFTRRSEVRFTSIEIEGRLSEAWLLEALGRAADAELERIARG